MLQTEKHEDCKYIYQINQDDLWKEVKETKMPFHKWYKWIDKKIMKLRDDAIKKEEKVEEKK